MTANKALIGAILIGVLPITHAQDSGKPDNSRKLDKIAWHGTWKGGLAEAKRTGKAILLLSAAPQCHSVPGIW